MPRRARYLGKGQIAVCMRSGIKCHASELVRDGRIPSLLVLPEWADPPQPQERPYVPDDLEGAPPFTPSPDQTPSVAPELDAGADLAQVYVVVDWTAAEFIAGPRIESYDLYRDDGSGFVILDTIFVEYDSFGGILGPDLTYNDLDVEEGRTYTYRVVANGDPVGALRSNTASVTMPGAVGAPTLAATLNLTTVELSWTDLVNAAATQFQLYRAVIEDGQPGDYELIYTGLSHSFNDNPPGDLYRYYVVGLLGDLEYDSNTQDVNVPAAPTAVVLSGAQESGDIALEWTQSIPTGGTITGYSLYKSVDGGAYSLLVDQEELDYLDTDTPDGHVYSYYVVAHDSNGFSSPDSNVLAISIGAAMEVITSSRTWVKPEGLVSLAYKLIAAGGGGASGEHAVANGNASGGGGGGGGEARYGTLLASDLGDTEEVVIGLGGQGGAPVPSGNVDPNEGTNGGDSSFGSLVIAKGGMRGRRSGVTGGLGGTGGTGGTGEDGGNGSHQANRPPENNPGGSTNKSGPGGGGGGAHFSGPSTHQPGAPGGSSDDETGGSGGPPGSNGVNASNGQPGGSTSDAAGGGGGGGGAGWWDNGTGTPFGGDGAPGGTYGAGGGGGGCGLATSPSGAGGDGADGVLVLEYTYGG